MLSPGQAHDLLHAAALIDGERTKAVIADTAFDARAFREKVWSMGARCVIPSNPTRKRPRRLNKRDYKLRNRIERCINKLKHFRHIATRYDRRAEYFLAFIHLACAMIWMR